MQTPELDSNLSAPFRELTTMRVVWGALLCSVGIYVFIAATRAGETSFAFNLADANPQDSFEMILSGMGLLMAVLAFAVPNFILNAGKKSINPQSSRSDLAKRYFVPFIIRLALLESCTIYGLILADHRKSIVIMLPMVFLSVIGYFLSFPSEAKIRASLQGPERI